MKRPVFCLMMIILALTSNNATAQVMEFITIHTQSTLDHVFNQLGNTSINFSDKVIFIYPNTDIGTKGTYNTYATEEEGFSIKNKHNVSIFSNTHNTYKIIFKGKTHTPNSSSIDRNGLPMLTIENSENIIIDGIAFTENWGVHAIGIKIWATPDIDYQRKHTTNNINISNCEFKHIGWHPDPKKKPVFDINDRTTENATANAILTIGDLSPTNTSENAITNLQISNNVFYNIITGYSETISLNGNIDGFTVWNNTISNITNIGIDATGHYSWTLPHDTSEAAAAVNFSRNGIITNNTVRNFIGREDLDTPAGIYIDGGSNITLSSNHVEHFPMGYSVDCEVFRDKHNSYKAYSANNNIVKHNKATNCWEFGLLVGAASFSNNSNKKEDALSIVSNTLVYGNIFEHNNKIEDTDNDGYPNDYGQITLQNNKNTVIKNNILTPYHKNRYAIYNLDPDIFTVDNLVLCNNTINNTINCVYPKTLAQNQINTCTTNSYTNNAHNNTIKNSGTPSKTHHKTIDFSSLIKNNETNLYVKIYNLNGKIVMSFNAVTDTIDVSSLKTGIYLLKTKHKTIRFIKK